MSGHHGHAGEQVGHHGHEHADAWHHHDASEGLPQEEHAGTTSISAMAKGLVLIIVATVGLVAVTMLYMNHHMDKLRRERVNVDLSSEYVGYKAASTKRLEGFGWVDASTVHVPVKMAQDRVLKRYGGEVKGETK
ncbi:MAG: hypothetical protein HEQ23_07400 [Tepidisphaera sp.]|jgi:hypothetical protein